MNETKLLKNSIGCRLWHYPLLALSRHLSGKMIMMGHLDSRDVDGDNLYFCWFTF